MAIRLKDIAADLGISFVTVSRVLRNKSDVSEETRQRVLKRVSEVNYRPNLMARGLASGKSYTVGFIVPDLVHTFFAEVAKGLSGTLRRSSYQLILASAEEDPELERQEIDNLLARGVDALLIASCQEESDGLRMLSQGKTPYILIDREIRSLQGNFVGTDDLQAGYIATEHLLKLGRRRVAHIGGESISTSLGRLAGYRKALEDYGIPFRQELVAQRKRLEDEGVVVGSSVMDDLLMRQHRPDAVFCYNDITAVGAIRSLLAHGLRVPEDVAVIGCGNLRLSSYLEVPLSSVDQSTLQLGEKAAKLALSLIGEKNKRARRRVLVEPHVIARASTIGATIGESSVDRSVKARPLPKQAAGRRQRKDQDTQQGK
jgi:LacI family transcriptional regulator